MTPRTKEANAQIKDERREQILYTALKLFTKKGLADTKISDIAQAAGISHGLLYNYFKSKDEIYTELIRIAVSSSGGMLEQIEQTDMQPIEKVHAITYGILNNAAAYEESACFFALMMQAMSYDKIPETAAEIMKTAMKPMEAMCRIITDGQSRGQIKPCAPDQLAAAYFAAVNGLVYFMVFGVIAELPDPGLLIPMFLPN